MYKSGDSMAQPQDSSATSQANLEPVPQSLCHMVVGRAIYTRWVRVNFTNLYITVRQYKGTELLEEIHIGLQSNQWANSFLYNAMHK